MSVYHLGKWWNQMLEPTNVQAIWNHPEFRSLDDWVGKYRPEIIQETLELLQNGQVQNMLDFDPQHRELMLQSDQHNSWGITFLKFFGQSTDQTQEYKHLELIVNHPLVYNMSISVLKPGGYIPPHVGQCRALVKYHIPIKIPPNCYMIYDGQKYDWIDRMLFDDTLIHSVYNKSSEPRVILLIDILRPMGFPWNIINTRISSLVWIDPNIRDRYQQIKKK